MAVGIMGGTFDPIHLGHMRIASAALEELKLERVIFLPDGDPPHKRPSCTREDRLAMVRLACADEPRFAVSDMELRRQGRTYTVDTLLTLKAQYPDRQLVYLVGSDTFFLFPTWRTAEKVARLCRMAIVLRPGDMPDDIRRAQEAFMQTYGLDSILLSRPGLDISSSGVRDVIRKGQPVENLVPARVDAYIKLHGLYGHAGQTRAKPLRPDVPNENHT